MSDRLEHLYAAIAARPADGVIGWRGSERVSNAAFLARVHAWHGLLIAQAGRNFALYLDDSIEFGAALLGAWHAGKTVWLSADTLPATCASLSGSVDGFLGQFPPEFSPMQPHAALPVSLAAGLSADLNGAMPALVVFTSGSTGAVQAIPKKLSQMASEVETLDVLFGERAGAAAVWATVSHQHIYGLLFKVLWPLTTCRGIHALSVIYPEELTVALAEAPCVLIASPAHLKRVPEHLDWRAAAGMLRVVFSSGGPLAPDAALAAGALLGTVPVEVYGSSETGGVAWRQRSAIDDNAWTPFPTVAWRLDEEDGALEVRSPHLPDDNWLALADRAERVEQRFLLLGRRDRIVKIEEKRISLSAMEAALTASGLAAEARVLLCEPDGGERQRLAAFVVPTAEGRALLDHEGKAALNHRLRAVLADVVEAVALPRRWRYLDQMPVNSQGKTTMASLLALLDGERPRFPRMRELENAQDRVVLELTAPANLLYFDGHFDVAPILPGVVQIDWAIHYGRQYFELPPVFKGMQQLKFQQVVVPDAAVRLELTRDAAKGSLQFRYVSEAGQHASGRILFGAADV
ncbi:acyl-CoA synthetase (AMP-forming)/AMP-acid ligase II [Duganella sp. SG902]|uniref:ApeI family dehydratase n=1 Tax=Duganella sp. SG902 TaxID=2587016 RepID=UPI00159DE19C|nr:AMP-binding protein [Duganella sp. SG902]NVM77850.1 acyl-CoA synthetase (AMP-forming)/AMP-acid ligase II [Duganella sp. SG902]